MATGKNWLFCPRSGALLVLQPSTGKAVCPDCDFTRPLEGKYSRHVRAPTWRLQPPLPTHPPPKIINASIVALVRPVQPL